MPPLAGGAYQYNLSFIKALESLDETEYSVTAFIFDQNWLASLPQQFKKILLRKYPTRNFIHKIFKILYRKSNNISIYSSFFNPAISLIDKSSCDLVILPGQEGLSYQIKKPALTAVHDLMHRYAKHYSEYQNGVYERREKHYRFICEYSKGILVDSSIGKQHVIESYQMDPEKIDILPFVPPNYLKGKPEVDAIKKYGLPDRYIFYPAQFWEHKNHIKLIEAVAILHHRGHQIHLVLVGGRQNNYKRVVDKIHELNLNDYIQILGYVSNEEILSLYKKATVMAFVSCAGPSNIPPLEALLLGCPLVVSNLYAMPEQVGDAALLVDPNNEQDIADKLELVITNNQLRIKLIDNGIKRIKEFSQEKFNDRIKEIIDRHTS